MRVGCEGMGGAPFDATATKDASAATGDGGTGAGFFALLALLQGAATPDGSATILAGGEIADDGDDGAPDLVDVPGAAHGGVGAGGDVVVELSEAAALAAAAGAQVAEAGTVGKGADAATVPVVARPQGAAVGTDGSVAAADVGGVEGAPAVPAGPPTAGARNGGAVVRGVVAGALVEGATAPVAGEHATTGGPKGAGPPADPDRVATSGAVGGNAAPVTARPHDAGDASAADASPDASTDAEGKTASAPESVAERRQSTPGGDDAAADDPRAGRDGDGRFAERHGTRPAAAAGGEARAGLEPARTTLEPPESTARPSGAAVVPDRTTADGGARAAGGAQRAALTEGGGLPGWIERVASAQRLGGARRATALRFDLEPAGLGRIEVRISFGAGGLRAQVMTEHDHTRILLAQQQPQLAAALERNDVRLESFLVDVGVGGDASGEARREVDDGAAYEAAFARAAADEVDDEPAALPRTVTGLLSVRA